MKRWALRFLIASIIVSAATGIWALLIDEFDEFQARILFSSLCTIGGSICMSACAAAWERRQRDVIPPIGMLSALGGFGMLTVAVWWEIYSDWYFQLSTVLITLSFSLAHVSLLSLARLRVKLRWVMGLAMLSSLGLAGLLISLLFWNYPPDWLWRVLGILVILVMATTAAVPVLHRLSRDLEDT